MEKSEKIFLEGLNEQQIKAVKSIEGATLLLAVPGSGKTTVLIKRLGYMTKYKSINPNEILVITYTVNATEDMKKRYTSFYGDDGIGDKIEFRTINGICAKILYRFKFTSGKEIYDLADEKTVNSIITKLYIKNEREFPSEQEISTVRTSIAFAKNMLYSDSELKKMDKDLDFNFYTIYHEYISEMKNRGLMDYDDQMVYTYNIFKSFPNLLEEYQEKYKYICVDEAQDTSKIQHMIIRMIAQKYNNIFMVGDEDQTIYESFRAAYPEALLNFEKDYKNANILLMETNYRSNAEIVTLADDFIQHNTLRHKKSMKAYNKPMSKPEFLTVSSREEQYKNLFARLKRTSRETAVLYRNNESCLPLVDMFDRENIDYTMKNADLTFFKHKAITDIKSIIKLSENPFDTESFMNIYYKLYMYIDKKTALLVCDESKKRNKPILNTLYALSKENKNIPDYVADRVSELIGHFKRLKTATARGGLLIILNSMNYWKYIENNKGSIAKIEILKLLAVKEKSLFSLMERLDYLQDIMTNKISSRDSNIILSTIHSSKGLEYNDVYMIDVMDGVFPDIVPNLKKINDDERRLWEEERRIFYVGITRAKFNLYIYDIYKSSVFIKELKNNIKKRKNRDKVNRKIEENKESKSYSMEEFKEMLDVGVRIKHKKYGSGTIKSISDDKFSVLFDGSFVPNTFSTLTVYSLGVVDFE